MRVKLKDIILIIYWKVRMTNQMKQEKDSKTTYILKLRE